MVVHWLHLREIEFSSASKNRTGSLLNRSCGTVQFTVKATLPFLVHKIVVMGCKLHKELVKKSQKGGCEYSIFSVSQPLLHCCALFILSEAAIT